ncbi:DUF2939 domain-containing protein [Enterovirga sp.]|uniref:DUF2939 domain-containing protein n=1 Tax=Enterovirga sp. TaxID=2026350 RepID=UPI00261E6068|nr:DUF2939 domain-containing protein [Enterovirga sp.]MDB5590455.1 hypothetical protein [Enterovirga sp.]
MRWFVGIVLALAVAWLAYAISPYWALYRLADAVQRGDVAAVTARVNVRALRYSLAKQVGADLAAAQRGGIASADAQLAAGTAAALADPFLDHFLSPEGIVRLLRTGPTGTPGDGAPFSQGASVSLDDLDDFLAASTWRGFRNIYVTLPADQPREARFRLQLRLGQLRWRLVGLELPARLRQRIVDSVLRRRKD